MSILDLIKLAPILCFKKYPVSPWEPCQVYSDDFTLSSKSKETKVKKIPPASPPPPPPRHFKPDWFPFPFLGSPQPPPLHSSLLASIFSSLFFHARIILCGGNVSTVCSRQQSRTRDVEKCNASVCLFKVQLYCTSPHNDSVLNMNFTFCWYMDRFKRNILYLLMRVVLFMRVFSPFKQFIA